MNKTLPDRLKELLRKRNRLARKLAGYKHLLRGTIVKRGNICGTPNCRCKRKIKPILHGPYPYLSHRSPKATNMIFLNKKKLSYAMRGVSEYNELIEIVYRISVINFEILRYHHRELGNE